MFKDVEETVFHSSAPKKTGWQYLEDGTNLYYLAKAIAWQETHNCTKGHGITYNNCFGIMWWPDGVRTPKRYETAEESYQDFYSLWKRKYKRFPDADLSTWWTGADRSETWLRGVIYTYNQHKNDTNG